MAPAKSQNAALHRFAQFVVLATFCLIFLGAMVTSKGAGLAVPDWPLSYGSLNPPGWFQIENVRLEHGHRLFAAAVGLLTTILAIWIAKKETRPWIKALGWCAFIGVILQGVLGGLRVTHMSTVLAIVHGCVAQAFLGVLIVLSVALSPRWLSGNWKTPVGSLPAIRAASWLLVAAVYAQLILGAVMRHLKAGLAIPDFPLAFGKLIPPLTTAAIEIHFAHRLGAVVVTIAACAVLFLILTRASHESRLLFPAITLGILIALQITLGAHIIWLARPPVTTTLHVVSGAAILGTGLLLALNASRLNAASAFTAPRQRQSVGVAA